MGDSSPYSRLAVETMRDELNSRTPCVVRDETQSAKVRATGGRRWPAARAVQVVAFSDGEFHPSTVSPASAAHPPS